MHHLVKKAAVAKYSTLTGEELATALKNDDKNFSAEDIAEITAAINSPADTDKPQSVKKQAEIRDYKHKIYEEWRVEVTAAGKIDKLKKIRGNVKLHEPQVEELNSSGKNAAALKQAGNFIMYYEQV